MNIRTIIMSLLCAFVSVFSCHAQPKLVTEAEVLADMLAQICTDSTITIELLGASSTIEDSSSLVFSLRDSPSFQHHFSLLDSLEMELGIQLTSNYPWLNPLYGLAIIELIAEELEQHNLLSQQQKKAYCSQLIDHYEASYARLTILCGEQRLVNTAQPEIALIIDAYDIVVADRGDFNAPRLYVDTIWKDHASYLQLLEYNQQKLEVAVKSSLSSGINPIVYYAFFGLLTGILITLSYYQFYQKKHKKNT